MGQAATVKVLNVGKLSSKLQAMGDAMAGKALEQALSSGALLIQNEAKVNAPVLTGELARSITHETQSSGQSAVARIGTNKIYAPIQEFGGSIDVTPRMRAFLHAAKDIHLKASTNTINIPAQPYLRPAFDSELDNAKKEVAVSLKIIVDKSAS